jgi:hypothetical protein
MSLPEPDRGRDPNGLPISSSRTSTRAPPRPSWSRGLEVRDEVAGVLVVADLEHGLHSLPNRGCGMLWGWAVAASVRAGPTSRAAGRQFPRWV